MVAPVTSTPTPQPARPLLSLIRTISLDATTSEDGESGRSSRGSYDVDARFWCACETDAAHYELGLATKLNDRLPFDDRPLSMMLSFSAQTNT